MSEDQIRRDMMSSVSRETGERLDLFVSLLKQWSARINLVSSRTIDQIWARHIADSVQLARLINAPARWLDMGAGAGLPGLIVSMIHDDMETGSTMTLVESDGRKAAFLWEAARQLDSSVIIENKRIEAMSADAPGVKYDVVTSRALAPLSKLLSYSEALLAPEGLCIFPKGANAAKEVSDAKKEWRMSLDKVASVTDSEGVVLMIREFNRVIDA